MFIVSGRLVDAGWAWGANTTHTPLWHQASAYGPYGSRVRFALTFERRIQLQSTPWQPPQWHSFEWIWWSSALNWVRWPWSFVRSCPTARQSKRTDRQPEMSAPIQTDHFTISQFDHPIIPSWPIHTCSSHISFYISPLYTSPCLNVLQYNKQMGKYTAAKGVYNKHKR